jgi:hypothetical protein
MLYSEWTREGGDVVGARDRQFALYLGRTRPNKSDLLEFCTSRSRPVASDLQCLVNETLIRDELSERATQRRCVCQWWRLKERKSRQLGEVVCGYGGRARIFVLCASEDSYRLTSTGGSFDSSAAGPP